MSYSGPPPTAIFIGTPPTIRGTLIAGQNVDVIVAEKFPSAALFIEKPVSSARPFDVHPLMNYFAETGRFVTVGYMLRYLKGIFLIRN